MNNLALGYQAAGKLDKALPLFEETRQQRSHAHSPGPPRDPHLHGQPGRYGLSRPSARSTRPCRCTRRRSSCGQSEARARAPTRAPHESMSNLAERAIRDGRQDRQSSVAVWRRRCRCGPPRSGPTNPTRSLSLNNLRRGLSCDSERWTRRCRCWRKTLKRQHRHAGGCPPRHAPGVHAQPRLWLYGDAGTDSTRPCRCMRKRLKLTTPPSYGADHPNTLGSMNNLASGLSKPPSASSTGPCR